MRIFLPCRCAEASAFSVPRMFVITDWSGCSTTSFTPTAAARCTTASLLAHELVDRLLVEHRALDEPESVGAARLIEVVEAARGEIVDDRYLIPAGEEGVGQVGADEAGTTSDERVQPASGPLARRVS